MAPSPLQCSAQDCDYETTSEGTIQQRIDLLTLHTNAVHVHGAQQQHACQPGSRLEKLPRPVFTLNMTEAAWDFKVIEWESYIQQSTATDNAKLLQLRAACRSCWFPIKSIGLEGFNFIPMSLLRKRLFGVKSRFKSMPTSRLFSMFVKSSFGLWGLQASFVINSLVTGQSFVILVSKLDNIVLTSSSLPGKIEDISVGFNFRIPPGPTLQRPWSQSL